MNEDDKNLLVTGGCLSHIIAWITGFLLAVWLLGSCTTTKYVTVPEVHTEHHWHTDSVIRRDSVYHDKQTTVMQLDSAAMARYGIQLKSAERAWLVQSNELLARLTALEHMAESRDTLRDSIPVPYPVEVKVPADLSWWQTFRLHVGDIALVVLGITILLMVAKWRKWQI
jgi:hypothetical protein